MTRFISACLVFWLSGLSYAEGQSPSFNVRTYGNFRKIIETKGPEGVVGLEQALSGGHSYAVGELKNAEGEVTVYNGEVWLNYGGGGINFAVNEIPKGEQAMELITARVDKWQEIVIPKNMTENELYYYVLDQARKLGLDVKAPVPCAVEGNVTDPVWHVLNGAEIEGTGNKRKLFFTRLVGYRQNASVILLGFCSETQDGYTFPGELWHVHVLFKDEKTAGHIDAFSVLKGAKLRLPAGKAAAHLPEQHPAPPPPVSKQQ